MSVPNIQNILRQISVILIAATGETLVILIGGIDLSVGATIGLASVSGALCHARDAFGAAGRAHLPRGRRRGRRDQRFGHRPHRHPAVHHDLCDAADGAGPRSWRPAASVGALPKTVLVAGRLNLATVPLVFFMGVLWRRSADWC